MAHGRTILPVERAEPSLHSAVEQHNDPGRTEYLREARRLRGRLRSDPARLHRSLRDLSERRDQDRPIPAPLMRREREWVKAVRVARAYVDRPAERPAPGSPGIKPDAHEHLAAAVQERLEGGVLRPSQRQAVFRMASQLGINRFEANLVIASVQHRYAGQILPVDASSTRLPMRLPNLVMTILFVEAAVGWAVWWTLGL